MSKSFVRSIKNVTNGYSLVQKLVRNATLNDPLGPTTFEMEELAQLTHQSQTDFLEIMDMLDRRLNDKGKNWRHVAKSLTVLDYLVRFGSEKCVLWAKDNLYIVKTLREFIHFDEADHDQGALIRVKAKELVSFLRDDERLRHERELAQRQQNGGLEGPRRRRRRNTTNTHLGPPSRALGDEPYDEDLQRALELLRVTAEDEQRRLAAAAAAANNDPDLEAALKLLMEEEEMRRQKRHQNENLLDLSDAPQPQYYLQTQAQQAQQQYDMFGNPIPTMQTGYYAQPQQQVYQPTAQYVPHFTGFHTEQQQFQPQPQQQQQQQQPQQQQPLQPLKTGSNNPFALQDESRPAQEPTLNDLSQPQFFTQPQQPTQPVAAPVATQNTSSRYNDSTHSELNNLLAQGTGIDTFGNTGASRIPHQHTKTQQFINSSGTGIKQAYGDVRLLLNATGNPFLNTGIGYQGQQQQAQAQINPAYTGYGFGNAPQQQQLQRQGDGPSLIDI